MAELTVEQAEQRLGEIRAEQLKLADSDTPQSRQRLQALRAEYTEVERECNLGKKRQELLRHATAHPENVFAAVPSAAPSIEQYHRSEYVGTARRAVDRLYAQAEITEEAALINEARIRTDRTGRLARYVAAVSDPLYSEVFASALRSGGDETLVRLGLSDRHYQAMAEVNEAQRQLSIGGGGPSGSYAVPFTLDPSLILTSDASTSPLRQLATVKTLVSGNTWQGVLSSDIVASFDAELTETDDDKPALDRVEIPVEKAQAFVPFSIEIDQDWPTMQAELMKLLRESKDRLEATKFLGGAGHGSNEPEGILVGATNHVTTAASNTLATEDVYALKAALGARFQANASWLGSPAMLDTVRQFTGPGSDEMPVWSEGPPPSILRKSAYEVSDMDSTLADGTAALIYGDIAAFIVVDKIGLSVELILHVFGEARGYPSGQRGLYAYWRTGSVLAVDNAIRVLRVKS